MLPKAIQAKGRRKVHVSDKPKYSNVVSSCVYSIILIKEYKKWEEGRTKVLNIVFDVLQKFHFYDNLM